ncbi:hypothetical protein Tco_1214888 [Tanacetum coccineum]
MGIRSFMRLSAFLREAPFTMLLLYITGKVAGKPVSISEASIRSDLLFDDADRIDSLPNQDIFDAIQLMGQSEPQPIPSPPHLSKDQHKTQTGPSPRPSPTTHIPDSIPEGSGGNHGGQSSSDRSLTGNQGGMTLQNVYDLCISLCTQKTEEDSSIALERLDCQQKQIAELEPEDSDGDEKDL